MLKFGRMVLGIITAMVTEKRGALSDRNRNLKNQLVGIFFWLGEWVVEKEGHGDSLDVTSQYTESGGGTPHSDHSACISENDGKKKSSSCNRNQKTGCKKKLG